MARDVDALAGRLALELDRRRFLQATLTAAAGLGAGLGVACDARLPVYPFTLGIASGDPLPDRVILWTRLAPDPIQGGGMPDVPVSVVWELAEDAAFTQGVRRGLAVAHPSLAHSVHVDVPGLLPARWYFYRFRAGGWESPVGRTKTAPAEGSLPGSFRFASASCSQYRESFWTAYANMADEDLDAVVFLGDYIYESGLGDLSEDVRLHDGGRCRTLLDYRNRHALYKTDVNLQEVHRIFPWIVTWDDHEVSNNYAGDIQDEDAPDSDPPASEFLLRRAAGYAAWYEHMPVRVLPPKGDSLEIFREVKIGDLLAFFVLDTRQYRTNQQCGDAIQIICPEFPDPNETFLGDAQEAWLLGGLSGSQAVWKSLAQQVIFSPTPFLGQLNFDQWDGYPFSRQRIVDHLVDRDIENFVVLTGDVHASGAASVPLGPDDLDTRIGSEFVAPGIGSSFDDDLANAAKLIFESLPHVDYLDGTRRGYVRHTVTPASWRADFRLVDTARQMTSPIRTDASFVSQAGVPGIVPG
ncbi:MAG: alkaline phosphatase D family protein [Myxococcota bacterium]|nr:alkaline phosphatase D family protein [Myxococcota bacterium]